MNDAPLAAVHGAEVEWPPGLLHSVRRGGRAQPQLLDAQQPVIIGVEAQPGVMLGSEPQRLHGQKFQRQQHLGFVREQHVDVRPREFHQNIGIF